VSDAGGGAAPSEEQGRTQTGRALVLVVVIALIAVVVLRHTGSSVAGSATPTRPTTTTTTMTEAAFALLNDVTAPWRDELVRRALVEVTLLGVAGGVLGCWVVLYGLSYGAEALAHGMFPGIVLAALVGAPILVGGRAVQSLTYIWR